MVRRRVVIDTIAQLKTCLESEIRRRKFRKNIYKFETRDRWIIAKDANRPFRANNRSGERKDADM